MKREWKEELWEAYLAEADFVKDKAEQLKEIGKLFFEDVSFLYEIYPLIGTGRESREYKESGLVFETEAGDLHIFRKEGKAVCFKTAEMKTLLADMIGMFEEMLPIGSIVDLKKEILAEEMDVSEVKNFRVAIVKRFIGTGEGIYYPYGAVVYPVGTAGRGRVISFTPALIERIVFNGYSDEVEEFFVYGMKQELIINQRRKSAGFATKQELEKFRSGFSEERG